jgi:tetratricopeptide (TPR) repeat protein
MRNTSESSSCGGKKLVLKISRKVDELDLDKTAAYSLLGHVYYLRGDCGEALRVYEGSLDPPKGRNDFRLAHVARASAKLGKTKGAKQILAEILDIRSQQYIPALPVFELYMAFGDIDGGFEYLQRATTEELLLFSPALKTDQAYDEIRSDPRFAAVLRRLGLSSES